MPSTSYANLRQLVMVGMCKTIFSSIDINNLVDIKELGKKSRKMKKTNNEEKLKLILKRGRAVSQPRGREKHRKMHFLA